MIKLNVLSSPDQDVVGNFSTGKYRILVGTSHKNDLIINDPSLKKLHFVIECRDSGLTCCCKSSDDFFISNGKKIGGVKIHKTNDVIKIGDTSIKILDYFIPTQNRFDFLHEACLKLQKEMPSARNIIQFFRKELIHLKNLKKEKDEKNN